MQFETIADLYAANDKIRENFINTVSELTTEQENLPSENGKWTLGGIIEHIAKAEVSMMGICYKLLSKAKKSGESSDGSVKLSDNFLQGIRKSAEEKQKFEAPEMVHPKGGIPIKDSLEMIEQNRQKLDKMKPLFEGFDGTQNTFPHPAFGEMTAQDWLALLGGHIARHEAQIKRILTQN